MSNTGIGPLQGVVAATVTPLRDAGRELDIAAVGGLVDFYAAAGISGVFVAGSTGEGLLLRTPERIALIESFVSAAAGRIAVAAHAGAQTTAEAVTLAAAARKAKVTAVAAVGPPYYRYDDAELTAHFVQVAAACAPVPFYLYEIKDRTGYAIPPEVVLAVREHAPNLVGMKVSDRSLDDIRAYLPTGLDVMVGSEPLIPDGLALGAVGAVSALAAALPRAVLSVLSGSAPGAHADLLRSMLARYPFQSALKLALLAQGVLEDGSVRAPLRSLTPAESEQLNAWLTSVALPGEREPESYLGSVA